MLAVLCAAWTHSAHAQVQRVLMLFQQERLPAVEQVSAGFERTLAAAPGRVQIFREYLDLSRISPELLKGVMRDILDAKYADIEFDLVITGGNEALEFMVDYGSEVFPNVPTVFGAIRESSVPGAQFLRNATGIVSAFDPARTLELALALQPVPSRIVTVSGTYPLDRSWDALFRERVREHEGRFELVHLSGLPLPEVLDELGRLPSDAIVIYFSMLQDGAGQSFVPAEMAARLTAVSGVPVYGVYDTHVGRGIVGGYVDVFTGIGEEMGVLALRILNGESPADIPWRHSEHSRYVVDWRELQRWNLDESRLPPGTVVEFREPSAWDRYRPQILSVATLLTLQSLLIAALWLRSRKLQAERALEQSQELYRHVVESQTELICRYRPDATLTFVNEAYCRYFGKTREELIGSQYTAYIPDRDRARIAAEVQSLVAEPRTETFVHQVVKPDGTVGWQEWTAHVVADESGRATEVQGIGRDITQLRLAENEARQRREEVAHLTRVGILGQLSGAFAHELNQPLTAILSNAQAAQRLLSRPRLDRPEMREILQDIVADDIRASEVIARLRNLLKKGSAEFEALDLTRLTAETLALIRGQLIERHIAVITRLDPYLPPTHGDRVQLQQVLLNLLLNAAEAMSSNEPNDRQLSLSTLRGDDAFLRVEVADNGTGFSSETAERLFEPFFTTKAKGLGLGLSICRSIVVTHGGRLTAANNPDRGATFSFTLPVR